MGPGSGIDFVGAGWAFPLATDATGGVALVVREREIEEAIRLILATAPGERPMRPEFGCRVHDHVFAPINASTAASGIQCGKSPKRVDTRICPSS